MKLISLLIVIQTKLVVAQNAGNLGFEYGNSTGWNGYVGSCSDPINTVTNTPVITLDSLAVTWTDSLHYLDTIYNTETQVRFSIQDASSGYDEVVPIIPKKCPAGESYSMKIGNKHPNRYVENLQDTFLVDSTNSLLWLHYAIVLQYDTSHHYGQMSALRIELKDSLDQVVNVLGGNGYFNPLDSIHTFESYTYNYQKIAYLNWHTFPIDLSAYVGQRLHFSFTTNDCTQNCHFGYAYFDFTYHTPPLLKAHSCSGNTFSEITSDYTCANHYWTANQTVVINGTTFLAGQIISTADTLSVSIADTLTHYFYHAFPFANSSIQIIDSIHVPSQVDTIPQSSILTNDSLLICPVSGYTLQGNHHFGIWMPNGEMETTLTVHQPGDYYILNQSYCGFSLSNSIHVSILPHPSFPMAYSFNQNYMICENDSVEILGNLHGTWNTGSTAYSIYIHQPGQYYYVISDTCYGYQSNVLTFTMAPDAPIPTIYINHDTIYSTVASSYQWFMNGNEIPGQTHRWCPITQAGIYKVRTTNHYGCKQFSYEADLTHLGIQENEFKKPLKLYPNPASNVLQLETDGDILQLMVYNQVGEAIHLAYLQRGSEHSYQLDVSNLRAGLYLIRTNQGEARFVKQ